MDTAVRLNENVAFASRDRQTGIVPVILPGNPGMRLWLVSRESVPKQFCASPHHGSSMIVEAALRSQGPSLAVLAIMRNKLQRIKCGDEPSQDAIGTYPRLACGTAK